MPATIEGLDVKRLTTEFKCNAAVPRAGMCVSIGNKIVGYITDVQCKPDTDNDLGGIATTMTFAVQPCFKCKRRTDGWRRILLWRQWHKRTCAEFALTTLDAMPPSAIIAGALFDFCAHLTTQPETLKLGAKHESPAVLEPLKAWAATRGLSLDEAAVATWQDFVKADADTDR